MTGYPDYTARDQEIRQLWKQGLRIADIARRFDRSPERIRQIIFRDPQKKRREERAVCLEGMMRLQNDLDMQWACEIIVPVLGLKGLARRRLGDLFRRRHRKSISLRQLMDFVLPYRFRSYFTSIPLLRRPGVGYTIYEQVLAAISACDFGASFAAEWRPRMDYHRRYWEEEMARASRRNTNSPKA